MHDGGHSRLTQPDSHVTSDASSMPSSAPSAKNTIKRAMCMRASHDVHASNSAARCRPSILDPPDGLHGLDLADLIKAAPLEAIRYESVRDPQSRANLALLTCRVFTQNDVVDRQTWHFHFTNSGVRSIREAPSATIQFDRNVFAADPRIAAMKWDRASESLKQAGRSI